MDEMDTTEFEDKIGDLIEYIEGNEERLKIDIDELTLNLLELIGNNRKLVEVLLNKFCKTKNKNLKDLVAKSLYKIYPLLYNE